MVIAGDLDLCALTCRLTPSITHDTIQIILEKLRISCVLLENCLLCSGDVKGAPSEKQKKIFSRNSVVMIFRNEKSDQRGSFRPDIPADIRPKTSARPPNPGKRSISARTCGRGRPRKNFGLKNFGLIFRSLDLWQMVARFWKEKGT